MFAFQFLQKQLLLTCGIICATYLLTSSCGIWIPMIHSLESFRNIMLFCNATSWTVFWMNIKCVMETKSSLDFDDASCDLTRLWISSNKVSLALHFAQSAFTSFSQHEKQHCYSFWPKILIAIVPAWSQFTWSFEKQPLVSSSKNGAASRRKIDSHAHPLMFWQKNRHCFHFYSFHKIRST